MQTQLILNKTNSLLILFSTSKKKIPLEIQKSHQMCVLREFTRNHQITIVHYQSVIIHKLLLLLLIAIVIGVIGGKVLSIKYLHGHDSEESILK